MTHRAIAFCPHCRRSTTIDSHGRCSHPDCDQVVLGGTLPVVKYPGAGAKLVTVKVLRDAYQLYLEGNSLRQTAAIVLPRTGYASRQTCMNQLATQWRRQGWPLRDRTAATIAASYRHGKAKDLAHRRALKLARGEVQGVRCSGVKTRYGRGRGEPCQLFALRGGEFCRYHEPARAEERAAELADLRSRRGH